MFEQLKVKQHPDKTFIGKIEKGFYFLGYHFPENQSAWLITPFKNTLRQLISFMSNRNEKGPPQARWP